MALLIDPSIPASYVYDGVCVLCSRAVKYCIKYDQTDPKIQFVAIKSNLGREIAEHNDVSPDNPHTFRFVENGHSYILTDAVFALAKRVGGPWKVIRLFRIIPRPIRDWVYLRIALNRYKLFGKLESCYLPDTKNKHRFILD